MATLALPAGQPEESGKPANDTCCSAFLLSRMNRLMAVAKTVDQFEVEDLPPLALVADPAHSLLHSQQHVLPGTGIMATCLSKYWPALGMMACLELICRGCQLMVPEIIRQVVLQIDKGTRYSLGVKCAGPAPLPSISPPRGPPFSLFLSLFALN